MSVRVPPRAGADRRRPFLTAEWRYLVMLNYEVDRSVLAPRVPTGTVLDLWRGRTLVSVVGLQFTRTRVLGVAVPFHRSFEEVNLRFYVRRATTGGEARRGVVFVRELVPHSAIAGLARLAYNEPYHVVPMRSLAPRDLLDAPGRITYEWRTASGWQSVAVTAVGLPAAPPADSEAAFIAEHYWGYGRRRNGATVEYEVRHPTWRVWSAVDPELSADVVDLYGPEFAAALSRPPVSALVAEGSTVAVYPPRRLTP